MKTQYHGLSRQAFIRLQGGELLAKGYDAEEIADILDVSISTVERWKAKIEKDGIKSLARQGQSGRHAKLTPEQKEELKALIKAGAVAAGYTNECWNAQRVAALIKTHFQVQYSVKYIPELLHSLGLSPQVPDTQSPKRDQEAINKWRHYVWPQIKKKAFNNGLPLFFEDESGFNLFPNICRTWSEVGVTPILIEPPKRKHHSAIGMISVTPVEHYLNFLFTIFPGSVVTEDLIFFLTELHFHYRKKVVFVWDNPSIHKGAEEFFFWFHPNWFEFYSFPPYSPELNPVESCWNRMKRTDMANFVGEDTESLTNQTLASAKRISDDPNFLASCFDHSGLAF